MKQAIILAGLVISLVSINGCAARAPIKYSGINGNSGFNNISLQQAQAECEYQADSAMNAALDRTRGGIFSGAAAYSDTMKGCMRSKGFNQTQ